MWKRPPMSNFEQCRKFISLSEKRVAEVRCGTFSRNQCSSRRKGSPPAFGGRTSRSHEPPGTINTIVSFSRCRDCHVEAKSSRLKGRGRCDSQSVEQTTGDHVFCGKCKGMPVTRVPLQACTRSWDKFWSRETRPE